MITKIIRQSGCDDSMFRRKLRLEIFVVLFSIAGLLCQCHAQFLIQGEVSKSETSAITESSRIDWDSEYYYATGKSPIPSSNEEPNESKAYSKARNYAKMRAIANLLNAVETTPVSYKATALDYMVKDMLLRQTIEGCVADAEIIDEQRRVEHGENQVVVVIRAPLYGIKAIGSAIVKTKMQKDFMGVDLAVKVDRKPEQKSTISADAQGPFTSLVIDCSGLKMEQALCPVIRKTDGTEPWARITSDFAFLKTHGVVTYVRSIANAKKIDRVGANPLIVKAIARSGSRFWCDPVVSDVDAERIHAENQTTKFLNKFDVFLIVDEK